MVSFPFIRAKANWTCEECGLLRLFYTLWQNGSQSLQTGIQSLSDTLRAGTPYPQDTSNSRDGRRESYIMCESPWDVILLLISVWTFILGVVMTLRELPFGRFRMPSTRVFTHEEATDRRNDRWILEYARDRVRIQDVLAGRVQVMGFSKSSHLHLPIHLIFTFFWQGTGELHQI